MPKRKVVPQPKKVEAFSFGGIVVGVPAAPYCDCERPAWAGLTRRSDGVWVRPCCMRRPKEMYEKYGDGPVVPR